MYKALFFLKKTKDEEIIKHFNEITLKHLSEIAGQEIKTAEVESNLLQEEKYSSYCEVTAPSKDKWNEMMASKAGKALNKDLMNFHPFLHVVFVNFEN